MAENKKSFIFYCDWQTTFNELPDNEAGILIKHLLAYVNDENPTTENLLIKAVFANIKNQLKRDLKKWEDIREKRSEAGKISAEKRKLSQQVLTSVESVQQSPTNSTVNVTDTVNVTVNEKELKDYSEDSNELRLATLLYDLILENNPDAKKPNLQTWAKDVDKMIRLDNRTIEQIEGAIRWSQQDQFWHKNILSTSKLRKQYDRIFLEAKNARAKRELNKPVITENELLQFSESILNDDRYK